MLSCSPAPRKNIKSTSGQNIKVFVRVRPSNENEKSSKHHIALDCPPNCKEIVVQERPVDKHTKKFCFDRVFSDKSTQLDVYKHVAKPLVEEVLKGFNCTIFAYGQTGTGKTYTMEGGFLSEVSMDENNLAGVIPRCVNQLFDNLRMQKLEFTMRVSFLELYNEELFDLLSARDDLSKLRMYEDATRKGSCIIQGLEEVLVRNKSDVYNVLEKGSAKRQTAATSMNAHSSRSHTVFTITVLMKENTVEGDELVKTGKLHLVDLAGSENIGRSGAVDKRAREAGNINQSLLTLGRVITSLVEKAPHVPYRESKLTRLLQDALGGRTKTSIIATVSPAFVNLEETLSTLDYACRAKNIQNKPEVNQRLNKKELIGEYTNEIEKLRKDLLAMREKNGVYLANDNYEEMVYTMEMQAKEITEKIAHIRTVETEMEKYMEMFEEVQCELRNTNEKLASTEAREKKISKTLECTQSLLVQTANERDEQKYLVAAQSKTEDELQVQGRNLLNVVRVMNRDNEQLHDKIDRKRKVEAMNKETERTFEQDIEEAIHSIKSSIAFFSENHQRSSVDFADDLGKHMANSKGDAEEIAREFKSMHTLFTQSLEEIQTTMTSILTNNCEFTCSFAHQVDDDMIKEIESGRKFVLEIFDNLTKSISKRLLHQQGIVTAFVNQSLSKIDSSVKFYESSYNNKLSLIKGIEAPLLLIEKIPSAISVHLNKKSNNLETNFKKFVENLQSSIDSLSKVVNEGNRAFMSEFPLLSRGQKEELFNIETSSKEVQNQLEKLSRLSEEEYSFTQQDGDEMRESVGNFVGEIEAEIKAMEDRLCSLNLQMNERSDAQCLSLSTVSKYALSCKEEFIISSDANKAKLTEEVENALGVTLQQYDLTANNLTSSTERIQTALFACQQKINIMKAELTEYLIDQKDHIEECRESIGSFLREKLEDVPTGLTPLRKEYCCPTGLAATSPHERILIRFRKMKSASNIPIPLLDKEEEQESGEEISPISNGVSSVDNSTVVSPCSEGEISSNEFPLPNIPALNREWSKDELIENTSLLSRSSSVNSLQSENEKENATTNKRSRKVKKDSKLPSGLPLKVKHDRSSSPQRSTTTRSRRILGPYN